MISVICCYNNIEVFNEYLLNSLTIQSVNYELIALDNTSGFFDSAAKALNYGAQKANGEILVFVHQDIMLINSQFLSKLENIFQDNKDIIIGLAGKNNAKNIISNLRHGKDSTFAGNIQIKEITEVQTLDECLIALTSEAFRLVYFDEFTCNGWHLYAVELCLSLKLKGYRSFVAPLTAYHKSIGNVDDEYYKCLARVIRKHKSNYTYLYATCSTLRMDYLNYLLLISKYRVKKILRNIFNTRMIKIIQKGTEKS